MEFILRIFFSGLISFVPSADGKELTVLMIKTPHTYKMADGSDLAHHRPLLLARSSTCEDTCREDNYSSIAQYLYSNKTPRDAFNALNGALLGGAAWELADAELHVVGPEDPLAIRMGARGRDANGALHRVPTTPEEREDFTWVADMTELAPSTQGFKSSLTGTSDPGDLVAARLKLTSGEVLTYSIVKVDQMARPIYFRQPSGAGPDAPYSQAVATWVEAKIRVPGSSLEIVDKNIHDGTYRRKMSLTPVNGVVEIALLNLPPLTPPDPEAATAAPLPGQHFQIYYDLTQTPPAQSARLVPHLPLQAVPSDPEQEWGTLHVRTSNLWYSNLLEMLGLNPRGKKGPYEIALCPITRE